MPFVVFRSREDAQKRPDGSGKSCITNIHEFVVDDSIGPYGGFVLDEIEVRNSAVFRSDTVPVVGPDGRVAMRVQRTPVERVILSERKLHQQIAIAHTGQPLYQDLTYYRCKAVKEDAERLAGMRVGWSWVQVADLNAVPKRGDHIHSTTPGTTPTTPEEIKPRRTGWRSEKSDAHLAEWKNLQGQAELIMERGGPEIRRNSAKNALRQYIQAHGHLLQPEPEVTPNGGDGGNTDDAA